MREPILCSLNWHNWKQTANIVSSDGKIVMEEYECARCKKVEYDVLSLTLTSHAVTFSRKPVCDCAPVITEEKPRKTRKEK